jgi:hypothetical protein
VKEKGDKNMGMKEEREITKDIKNKKLWEELISCFSLIRHGPNRKGLVK